VAYHRQTSALRGTADTLSSGLAAGPALATPLETRGVPVLQGLPVLGNLFTTRTAPAPASTLPPVQTQPLDR
jgi:hypothetical protein